MRMRRGCPRKHVRAIKQQEPGDTYPIRIMKVEGAASALGTSTIVPCVSTVLGNSFPPEVFRTRLARRSTEHIILTVK